MAINRKQWLRYTGAAAAGGALGVFVRGLLDRDPADSRLSKPAAGWVVAPAAPGSSPPPREIIGAESFSQSGEDLIVAFMVAHLGLGPRITYLDVGANDPIHLNNSYFFYKQGHRGVLVEPNGTLCQMIRRRRRDDTVLEAGIGASAATEADYYVMSEHALNTFSKAEAEHHVEVTKGKVSIREVIKLPLLDINDVMARHFGGGAPTFLSVDTEGLDLAILKSVDYGRFRPKIICAETLVSESHRTRAEIPEFMATRGYVVRGSSFVNTVFVDAKLL